MQVSVVFMCVYLTGRDPGAAQNRHATVGCSLHQGNITTRELLIEEEAMRMIRSSHCFSMLMMEGNHFVCSIFMVESVVRQRAKIMYGVEPEPCVPELNEVLTKALMPEPSGNKHRKRQSTRQSKTEFRF